MSSRTKWNLAVPSMAVVLASSAPCPALDAEEPVPDQEVVLKGGEEGTVFRSLTVTGEDRIRIEFDRPELRLELDPRDAPGLEWGSAEDVLAGSGIDLVGPLLAESRDEPARYLPQPWIDRFRSESVARFRPDLEGVEQWRLTVADSRSDTVATFEGEGSPPAEIPWNGLSREGVPVPPGVTCSYVLEATDRAGNHRSFVGPGFVLPPYRLTGPDATTLLFSVQELGAFQWSRPPAILAEAVSRLNQVSPSGGAIEVKVTASVFADAQRVANRLVEVLRGELVGDPARIRPLAEVRPDAPDDGVVTVTAHH